MKFIILTDTHLVPAGRRLYALDPAARLAAAVQAINGEHDGLAFVIVTGDLAHWGEQGAYEELKERMTGLRVPAVLMMGNHDRRGPFRAVFQEADDDGNGFVQAVRHFDRATILTLDTLGESGDVHAGRLCSKRLSFLEGALSAAPRDKPLLLFQHHPPLDLGLPHMDAFRLQDSEQEWQIFQRTRMPDFMFFGHIHRPAAGVWRGIPFHIQRATSHQVAFDLTTSAYIPGTHESPDYSLVTVTGRDIVILQRSFLYDGPTFSLDSEAAQAASFVGELQR
jgi:3',5'-cyclic AMP phosphodiesterase CpdA